MYHLTWPCTGMNHLSTAETFRTSNPPWLISAHSPFPTMDEVLTGACFKHFLHHRGLATRPETSAPTKRSAGSQRPLEDANLAPQGNSRATQRPSFHTASPSPRSLSNRTRPDPRSLSQGSSPPRELSRRASLEYYPQLRGPGHRRTALVQGASPIASAREHMSAERGSRADGRRPRASSSRADSTELKQFRCEYCGLIFGRKHHKERHVDNLHRKSRGYTCQLCGSTFHQKPNFQRHLALVHGELPFRCETCGAGFEKSTKLRRHVWTEHGDERSRT